MYAFKREFPEAHEFIVKNKGKLGELGFLCYGGSISYGTDISGISDVDLRGMSYEPISQVLGLTPNYGVLEHGTTDTVIYSFQKFMSLIIANNPNILELVGCKEEHYLYKSLFFKELQSNQDKYITKRVAATFGGYAQVQLKKLELLLADGGLTEAQSLEHLKFSMENVVRRFREIYTTYGESEMGFRIENGKPYMNLYMKDVAVGELTGMLSELENVRKAYKEVNHRNRKATIERLNKHAMHIVRLLLMGIEILETGKVNTYRERDLSVLMAIREGDYLDKNNKFRPEFYELKDKIEFLFKNAKKYSELPDHPDSEWLEDFVIRVNRSRIK